MKILLIQPAINKESTVFGIMEPLALEILSTAIKDLKLNTEIKILDLRIIKEENLINTLTTFKPNLVGITGITIDYPGMMQIAKTVKAINPKILIVVGGHHATMVPEDFYKEEVDFIFLGPSINTFPEFLKRLINNKPVSNLTGVLIKKNSGFSGYKNWQDNIKTTRSFIPDRNLTSKFRSRYRFDGQRWGLISTSGGCPFKCSFCACWKIMDGKYITRSAEEVVEEIIQIPEDRIFFGDDNTFADIARAQKIAELLLKKGVKKIIQGYCRADTIAANPDLFTLWARAGLFALTVGVEALSDDKLKELNKKSSVQTGITANQILADCGIHNYAHILIYPDFSEKDFANIWDYVYCQGIVHPVFPVLTPLPGTDFCQQSPPFLTEHQYYDLAHMVLPTNMDIENFYHHFTGLYRKNYSYRRWLKAKFKKTTNLVTGKNIFPWHETRAPELITIPITRYWLKKGTSHKKMKNYFQKFREKSNA